MKKEMLSTRSAKIGQAMNTIFQNNYTASHNNAPNNESGYGPFIYLRMNI